MPVPKIEETPSDEEDGSQKTAKIANALLSQSKDVAEKYGAIIVAALILFGIIYFWLFIIPKPVSVNVSLTEEDSGAAVSGARIYVTHIGAPFFLSAMKTTYAAPGRAGEYTLSNMPSSTAITVKIESVPDYEIPAGKPFTTTDTGGSVAIKLYRSTTLKIMDKTIFGSIGPACTKTFGIPVSNDDAAIDATEKEVNLLSDIPYFKPESKNIVAGETSNVSFSITTTYASEKGKHPQNLTGRVWINGTSQSAKVLLAITETPNLSIYPESIKITNSKSITLTITNKGESPITNIRISFADDKSRQLIKLVGIAEGEPFDLEKSEEKIIWVDPYSNGIGLLNIKADCTHTRVLPIEIDDKAANIE
ncbi:MAG: hypothetical protein WC408_01990 [Candidatus Micrarchaeia archaeon]|jgi:hypothetical protein